MRSSSCVALSLVLLGALAGCATVTPPPVTAEAKALDLNDDGLALLGLTLKNTHNISVLISPPVADGIVVNRVSADGKRERIFVHTDKPLAQQSTPTLQSEERMLAIKLPPGGYQLVCVRASIASANGCAPVCADFRVDRGQVSYLGHLDVLRRKRRNDSEPRAGGVLPLFDQWYAGFSNGTFEVSLADAFDNDLQRFRQRYAALATREVSRAVLDKIAIDAFDGDNEVCQSGPRP